MKKLILGAFICMFAVVMFSSCEKPETITPEGYSGSDLAGSVQLTGDNAIAKKPVTKYRWKAGSDLAGSVQ